MRLLRAALIAIAAFGFGAGALAEEPPLLPGSYRLEMRMASKTRLPIAGMVTSSSVSISLVELRRDGGKWIQSHRVCQFRSGENAALVEMIFPRRFIESLARPTYAVDLGRDHSGWSYRADLGLEHVGFKPDGASGRLPAAPDDPSVYDWDGDGRPGATLILSIPLFPDGELYVVQRGRSILHGRVVEPGRVEGGIDVRVFEQRVIGARPAILHHTPEIIPDSAASRFVLTRVDPESTCGSIASVEDSMADGAATP